MHKLDEILTAAESIGATDIHLIEGKSPVFRVSRTCIPLPESIKDEILNDWEAIKERIAAISLGTSIYGPSSVNYKQSVQQEKFATKYMSADWKEWRLRVVSYRTNNREAYSIRLQNKEVIPLLKLGLDPDLTIALRDPSPGLVLISGGACAGKTTTLHSIVAAMNATQSLHIRTLESPIEFTHESEKSLITQQNIGMNQDSPSYYDAVEDALVQDVNVIAFGEIKDLGCLKAALKAANLNLLVIATIHAPTLGWTLARVIDEFPESDRREAMLSLARSVKLVVHQKLVMTRSALPNAKTTIGTKMLYRAAHFNKNNNLKVFISPEKVLDIDEKFFFRPLERGLFQHQDFDKA